MNSGGIHGYGKSAVPLLVFIKAGKGTTKASSLNNEKDVEDFKILPFQKTGLSHAVTQQRNKTFPLIETSSKKI